MLCFPFRILVRPLHIPSGALRCFRHSLNTFTSIPGALFTAFLLATQAVPLASPGTLQERSTYPFEYIVAFGDGLSDNCNGSYAHGITGNVASVYG